MPGLLEQAGLAPSEALAEVSEAIEDALAGGVALDKNALHDALRERVRPALLPWCPGCKSHHVAGNLWRYGTRQVGAVLDAERRYVLRRRGRAPAAAEAVRRFLSFYGPSTVADFAAWAGMTGRHARRLWKEVAGELAEVRVGDEPAWLLAADEDALDDPPEAAGVRLLPPGDPYLQKPDRALLAPDAILRKELFRAVGSPGVVLKDGRLAGSWKAARKGRRLEITVRKLGRVARGDLEEEAAARGGPPRGRRRRGRRRLGGDRLGHARVVLAEDVHLRALRAVQREPDARHAGGLVVERHLLEGQPRGRAGELHRGHGPTLLRRAGGANGRRATPLQVGQYVFSQRPTLPGRFPA